MFALPDSWIWDFWFADDGDRYHLFFLFASKALHEPDARHFRASIGHAVSDDLQTWTRVADALVRGDAPAFDDVATWTGSVVRHPDGTWFLFYTGGTLTDDGLVQSVGFATSTDLMTWSKSPDNPVVEADARWYEKAGDSSWPDEAFRDPWVFADPEGDGWHMLVTARSRTGPVDDRGVVGHAWSADLLSWQIRPPLTAPGQGFGQLEVMQVEVVDAAPVLLFSCLSTEFASGRSGSGTGGVWAATASGALGPFDIAGAAPITTDELYSGRLIQQRSDGRWLLLAFRNRGTDGHFVGELSDPMPVKMRGGRLTSID